MTAKRRARRIASDEATAWARNLELGNPYAKSVLRALGEYVDGDGLCWVGIPSLAGDCDLSQDTVRRRLAWLEEIGAIGRTPQWLDENGRRNGDGRGKRTTDLIRLLVDADIDAIEARAAGRNVDENQVNSRSISPSWQQGLNSGADDASTRPALGQPSQCSQGLDSFEPEPEDPPKSPSGGFPDDRETIEESEPVEFAAAFEAYVGHEVMRRDLALEEFRLLTQEDRVWCGHAVQLYMAKLRELKQRRPMNFHLWVRTRGFREFPAPGAVPAKAAPPQRRFVQGDELKGLAVAMQIAERRELRIIRDQDLGEGVWTQLGPQADLSAMAAFAGADREAWQVVDLGTPQFAAWRDRLALWTGAEPQAERIFLEPFDPNVHGISSSNPNFRLRKSKQGFRVPAPWPPRRDGTWQVAGESE
ncbi:helix-turn-helix domain-containing protein [Bradyrhizobium sp. 41S5]|uniref:helix-turn-helix domain-containing protein n=1 Tax=Bradyrhizobium sp. 41S5 TaxID=1404443 RepID=UPI00156B2399|nr:helix-turn-helix domain-containing protein [Bradyrhizobium sp. 41S5]UFX41811.1 helix-turn-helix domain-containing protein [Bradyrhizobium sp. 41S5]